MGHSNITLVRQAIPIVSELIEVKSKFKKLADWGS